MKKQTKNLYVILSVLLILTAVAGGLYWGLNSDSIFNHKTKEELLVDVAWYSEGTEEFTITTAEELYDVAALSEYYTFEGQTIKLGADIVVNEGNAEDWAKKAPKRKWWPIRNFAGTFDGDGHTISGLYGYGADYEMGLFANTKPKSIIKNFELRNTYFKASGEKVGSISSNGSGTFEKIYTNAIVETDASNGIGGFIGQIDSAGESAVVGFYTRFTECWFDGEVRMVGNHGLFGGGFVGIFSSGTLEIKQSLCSGKISSETSKAPHMGGFIGDTKVDLGTNILNMDGCLSDVEMTSVNINTCGATIGRLRSKCTAEFTNSYATIESWDGDAVRAEATFTGNVLRFNKKMLAGYGGYQWTSLDFDKYWSVSMDSTPILQTFADEIPSLEGIAKAYDTTWYDKYTNEFIIDTQEKFFGLCILPFTQGVTYRGQTIILGCDVTMNTGKASKWDEEAPIINWIPIGNWTTKFEGNFDGQGHTISGIYTTGLNYVGLFGVTGQGSSVKNLKLVNSYIRGNNNVGGVIGRTLGDVEGIYSDAIVVSTGGFAGGIIGQTLEPKSAPVTLSIKNCWFAGNIYVKTDKFAYSGGIIGDNRNNHVNIAHCLFTGYIYSESTRSNPIIGGIIGSTMNEGAITLIDDCFSAGKLEAPLSKQGYIGSIIGYTKDANSKITNSYATTECCEKAVSYIAEKLSKVGQFPKEQLTGIGGYQWTTLDFNKYWSVVENGTPVLKFFAKKGLNVAGVPRMIDISWYNESKKEYVLDSAADLMGFSMLAASNNFEGKTVKLGADITINEGDASTWDENAPAYPMTPITEWNSRFAGTFDGQGHTISGVYIKEKTYAGLFGVTAKDSVVKNFKLVNSYIEGEQIVGSVIGRSLGNIENVYSDATVVSTKGFVGGIVGQTLEPKEAPLQINIQNCWYNGEMYITTDRFSYAGGILGVNQNNNVNISHCLFTGQIDSACTRDNVYVGGISGATIAEGVVTSVDDCFSAGVIKAEKSKTKGCIGSLVGYAKDAKTKVTNSYATIECWAKATNYIAGKVSKVGQFSEKILTGMGGYQWTTLDFNEHWAVVTNDTPVLKCFATETSSVAGVPRMIDISWYDESKKEYVLDSAADLMGFSMLAVSNNFERKTVKLGANITINEGDASTWGETAPAYAMTPITDWNSRFAGTFDGQGHTISGVYIKAQTYAGLFGATAKGSVVKNFKLVNSYIEGEQIVGSIVGRSLGNVESVYSNATVVSTKSVVGGVVGQSLELKEAPISLSITNCWYDGKLYANATTAAYAGGILGLNQNNNVTISHCLFTGEIHSECDRNNVYAGGISAATAAAGATTHIEDCFSAGTITVPNSSVKNVVGSLVGNFIDSNSKITHSYATMECWSTATHYIVGQKSVEGQLKETNLQGAKGYVNTTLDFENYWVAIKNDTPELKLFSTREREDISKESRPDTSWYDEKKTIFVLDTKEELLGFSVLAKNHTFEGKTIRLGADIVLNEGGPSTWGGTAPKYVWTPVGSDSVLFEGTFDGEDPDTHKIHSISGLYVSGGNYVGLFGVTAKGNDGIGKIQNLILKESYIEGTHGVGSIVGQCGSQVDSVYSSATVKGSDQGVGGIVGTTLNQDATINNCWFAGQAESTITAGLSYVGGILGYGRNCTTTISNCLNTGYITSHAPGNKMAGGIVGGGHHSGGKLVISDCLGAGTFSIVNTTYLTCIGSILGYSLDATTTITKSYGTTESWSDATHWIASTKSAEGQLQESTLKGANGYVNTTLDFDEYWVAIENGIPELKTFSTGNPADISKERRPDTSWYDENKTTFVLNTDEELLGFSILAQEHPFEGKTIRLGADIVLNEGGPLTWGQTPPKFVWTPVGSTAVPFEGTFDGEMHSISGLYVSGGNCVGLFGVTAQGNDGIGKVQNLILEKSYIEGAQGVGSIVGQCGSQVDSVYSSATVKGSGQGVGGIVGTTLNQNATINNCWFAGQAESTIAGLSYVGGILGYGRNCTTIINNCLNTGHVTSHSPGNKMAGGIVGGGYHSGGTITISNCLGAGTFNIVDMKYLNYIGSIIGYSLNASSTITNSYGTTECWSDATNWIAGAKSTTGQKTEAELTNTNLNLDGTYWTVMKHDIPMLKSFKAIAPDTTWYTSDEAGRSYTLSTAAQLRGLAILSKTYDFEGQTIELDKTLTKAIDLKGVLWTPIGSTSKPFAGTFNGNHKTISGVYVSGGNCVGLFGVTVKGNDGIGMIQNLIIEDSYIEGAQGVGSIVGQSGSQVDSVYSKATVKGSGQGVGGIVGTTLTLDTTINNCWFAGQAESTIAGLSYVGGILGYGKTCTTTISNCLNTGHIISHSPGNKMAGGIVGGGYHSGGTLTISNCLGAGTFNIVDTKYLNYIGSIIGYSKDTSSTFTNSYGTTECWSDATHWIAGTKSTTGQKTEAELKDTILNLDGTYWKAIKTGIPVLKTFEAIIEQQ